MSGWKVTKLDEIAEVLMGQSPPGESCNQNKIGMPLLNGPTEFTTKFPMPVQYTTDAKRICEVGDILFCVRGSTTGRMNIADQKYAIGRGIAAIRHKKGSAYQTYLKGLIDYCLPEMLNATSGSVFPNISGNELKGHVIIIPQLFEQKTIGELLSSLDDKLDLLHRQNKTLEQLSQTLFQEWFVEGASDSWEEKELEEYVWFEPREKIDRNKEYQFFEMKCLSNDDMHISEGVLRTASSASSFRNNDTLLAKITPCLENGKTGFVMHLAEDEVARGSTEFIVMRSKGLVSPYWIYCLARDNDFRENAILSMTGTSGRQRVQIGLLRSIKVKMNKETMDEFHKTVSPFFLKVKANQLQIRTLSKLRDTLLPKLMSGEVRIN